MISYLEIIVSWLVVVRIFYRMRQRSSLLCSLREWSAMTLTNWVTDRQLDTTSLAEATNTSLL